MAATIGAGDFRYEYQPGWAKLPSGTSLHGVSGVAVDSMDRVYVFQRQGPPVLVFDRNGHFLEPWERRDGVPADAHHIHVGPDDTVYLTDRDAHQVLLYDTSGQLLRSLGTRDQASDAVSFQPSCRRLRGAVGGAVRCRRLRQLQRSPLQRSRRLHKQLRQSGQRAGPIPGAAQRPGVPGRPGVRGRPREPPGSGVHGRRRISGRVDRFQVPYGSTHRRGNQVVYVTDQIPRISIYTLDGELLARGRTFEGAHQVYTDSEGSIYGIDTANQRVQKFVKL